MKPIIYLLLAGILLFTQGCGSNDDIPVAAEPQMLKLAAPILVSTLDSTVITLGDYFLYPNKIDSVKMASQLTFRITADSTLMIIQPVDRNFPRLSVMTVWSKGYPYSLLLERSAKMRFWFTFDPGNKKYKRIQIKGQMNEWNAAAGYLFEKDKKWHIGLELFPGKYQYKLIIDGREICDPGCRDSVSNGSGGYNSILLLGNLNRANFPELYTRTFDGNNVELGFKNRIDTIFVLWQNHLLDQKFWKKDSSGISITLPRKAKSFDRSYLRVWAVNDYGISNEILIPANKVKVLTNPSKLTRADREAMIMYFMMVDRFKNGNISNDAPLQDPDIDPKVNYMGGDIAGITCAVEDGYFTNLGINTLWISPVTQNPYTGFNEYPAPHRKFSGYHGYWPITLTTVDTRFGNSDDLHRLVSEAHNKGINVILDFVSHHVHQDYALLKDHPDWITQVELPGKKKNIRFWDEHRLTTWFDIFLPTFDLTKPEVANMVSDSATFWIKEYQLDGFRHDAAKHVPENYWRTLTGKLTKEVVIPEGRDVYQIGETFGSRELVKSYINPGMLDAQFEFSLYWDARQAFTVDNTSFRDLSYSLQQAFMYFGDHNLMGNVTGNQDMARFISYASNALSYNEDATEAGWKRDIEVTDTLGYRKLASMIAFNMTIPGIPVIYYGDEIGMPGAGDPDNRRMMKFDSLNRHETYLKSVTSQLAKLRKNSLPLIYGDFTTLKVNEKTFVYMRSYFDKAVIVVFNKNKSAREITFDLPERFHNSEFKAGFGTPFTIVNGKGTISPEPWSFEILTN